ncbi:AFL006Cp [Eremothecium gossypii ATCC 10895]|uniref:AFL006Cp n=1 Tax=Eremothecium gossypii (strain ATCC 10895 / CBS 109.51 / FGSC 9923 / NRRL Y-1056) TaxID=284811 RepID=Q754S7_EREGS|nr:AFL006Cp [Eremothecium gossypii ATCC 10895]AAS53366.1 AFL006Cp [Eremothecium gossypii ATCC 10895]AEY97677.1 FAFL006Cp [Eremothecium gossypii FDAG1]
MANRLLQDPFSVLKEYPETLTYTFEIPLQCDCLEFSPGGDYLAVGCSNGSLVIYDMDTKKPISVLGNHGGGHVRAVQSVAWSQCGRYLWSSSRDWRVKMWDLAAVGRQNQEYMFDGPVWMCRVLAGPQPRCIATVVEERWALLVDFSAGAADVREVRDPAEDAAEDRGNTLVTCLHPRAQDVVITGTSKGWVVIYRLLADGGFHALHSEFISNCNIKNIEVAPYGERMAINCSDRTIRQYALVLHDTSASLQLEHKYQDVINKLQWNSVAFSNHAGEYLVASAHGSSAHDLYVWETASGTLVRVLEGPEEELLDIDWNYYNMSIASNGLESGNVYVWSIVIPPKWSALAPDFEEVEENIEYREKEDEFDQLDELGHQLEQDEAEEVHIDLRTRDRFDVRGNDLAVQRFIIPTDYESILLINRMQEDHADRQST